MVGRGGGGGRGDRRTREQPIRWNKEGSNNNPNQLMTTVVRLVYVQYSLASDPLMQDAALCSRYREFTYVADRIQGGCNPTFEKSKMTEIHTKCLIS